MKYTFYSFYEDLKKMLMVWMVCCYMKIYNNKPNNNGTFTDVYISDFIGD